MTEPSVSVTEAASARSCGIATRNNAARHATRGHRTCLSTRRTTRSLQGRLQVDDAAHVEGPQEVLDHSDVRIELLQPVEIPVALLLVSEQEMNLPEEV